MDHAITRAAGATPRAVGEFQGFIDGEPSVVWADRKNMPHVGDKLFALPRQAAAPHSWAILLTSANHGTVGPVGSTFSHAGEHHERVQVMEIVEAGAPAVAGTDLAGLVSLNVADLIGTLDDVHAWARELPIPTRGTCSAMRNLRKVKDALVAAPIEAQAGQVAPTDMPNGGMHDSIFVKVWGDAGGGDTGRRALANYAYQLGKRDAAGQVAVPEAPALDDQLADATNALRHIADNGGEAGKTARAALHVIAAIHRRAAAPAGPAQAKPLPGDWISVDERLPEGRYCLATYRDRAGKLRIIRAMYVRQFEIEASGDECDSETNEANDLEYLKAGWYEMIDNWGEYSSVHVAEGPVTHWTPLPPLPGIQASTAGGRQEGGAA